MLVESVSGMDEHYNSEEKCAPIKENNSETETRLRTVKRSSLCIQCPPSMYRGRVFIGDGSPTTLRYYTVMPPNNYIPGIFPGYNRIFTLFGKLHPSHFCPLGPLQDSLRGFRSAYSPTPSLLVFDFAVSALVFALGALVFASLRFSSYSPVANRSSP